jgi:hypothetical protein
MKDKKDAEVIVNRLLEILYKKHEDYGPLNISGAPGGPMNGLRVRMYDKLARLNNLIDTGDTPNYESIEDTLIDLANYAIIGLLVQRGQWKGVTNEHQAIAKKVDHGKKSSSPERPTDSISRQTKRAERNRFREVLQT